VVEVALGKLLTLDHLEVVLGGIEQRTIVGAVGTRVDVVKEVANIGRRRLRRKRRQVRRDLPHTNNPHTNNSHTNKYEKDPHAKAKSKHAHIS